jgi:AmmeMemoRadiSam system protein A
MGYDHQLTEGEKRELLRIARATLREHVRSGRIPPGKPHRDTMLMPAAVVATLGAGGSLRGRSQTSGDDAPLYQAVQRAVASAASGDVRLEPVSEGEIDELTIELAVLGPRERVSGPDAVKLGTHGLVVSIGGRRAMLLPEIAADRGLDAEAFLAEACSQIGAEGAAWRRPDAVIEVFTAQIFREGELAAE